MSSSQVPWFMALVAVVMVVGTIVNVVQRRRKTSRMATFAHERGWHYAPADQSLVRYRGTPFGTGSSRRTAHVLTGHHRGTPFTVFEYRYTQSTGESSSTTYRFTIAVLPLPAVRPLLEVTRETGVSRFLGNLGFRDLQLESEDFNRTFRIATDNDRFAYDVLNPRTMEWLLAHVRTFPFRFGGDHLITWRGGAIEPESAVHVLEFAADLRDRVPSFVWRG